jgi:tetratricopeptide (TPR) repeat protein
MSAHHRPLPSAAVGNAATTARSLLLAAAGYAQIQQYDRAEAAYILALEQQPELAIARFQLGLLQLTTGRPAVAATTWRALGLLDDRNPLKLFKQGLEHLARDEFDAAIARLAEGIAHNPDNAPLNHDMELVIERIRSATPGRPPSGAPREARTEAVETTHFLLSAYKDLH